MTRQAEHIPNLTPASTCPEKGLLAAAAAGGEADPDAEPLHIGETAIVGRRTENKYPRGKAVECQTIMQEL